jgi:hypothetical protein
MGRVRVRARAKDDAYGSSDELGTPLRTDSFVRPTPRPRRNERRLAVPPSLPDAVAAAAMMSEPLVLHVNAGLCNRLRALLSYRRACAKSGVRLHVVWTPREECPGTFQECFEPLPGIHIESEGTPGGAGSRDAHDFHPSIKGNWHEEQRCFADLRVRPEIEADVERIVRTCGPQFIAMHIRRTDHYALALGIHTTDEDFYRYADRYPNHRIYLATDNASTQLAFRERYGERVVVAELSDASLCAHEPEPVKNLRLTTLRVAVVDLFTCARASSFKGSRHSSFSDAIVALRACRGAATLEDEQELLSPAPDTDARLHKPGVGAFRRQGGLRRQGEVRHSGIVQAHPAMSGI